ncbi:hypothetical protein L1987_57748 [Smallanthus sonchifolius]|uniref:Uncharacterized protein n=1 Tax=Smallanthus sonchifolius TaxID=185202 RepID=A0ACB9DDG6_9ASTR|nr:hypothetical protein L1987_57748 [Smallanthus sonchifolius]
MIFKPARKSSGVIKVKSMAMLYSRMRFCCDGLRDLVCVTPNSNRMLLIWGKDTIIQVGLDQDSELSEVKDENEEPLDPRIHDAIKEEVAKVFEQAITLLMKEMRGAIKLTFEELSKEKEKEPHGCTLK